MRRASAPRAKTKPKDERLATKLRQESTTEEIAGGDQHLIAPYSQRVSLSESFSARQSAACIKSLQIKVDKREGKGTRSETCHHASPHLDLGVS